MNKSEYQNPKSETMFKIQMVKCSKLFLSFVFWSFIFVSNLVLRISNFRFQRGQALITLLFFVIIATTITSAAVIVIIVNSTSISKQQGGTEAYYAAEAGLENAILRLLRDQNYTGETITGTFLSGASATISVSGSNPKTITSVGQSGNFKRTLQTTMMYTNGYYTLSSWKEI